jgi:hypothetical protein
MNFLRMSHIAFLVLLMATIGIGDDKAPHTYLKGTITGWSNRRDNYTYGGKIKVYELKGTDLIYQIGNCGTFQTGKFDTGQTVEYRADDSRLYVRNGDGKEFKCKIEGTRALEGTKPDSQ